MHLNSLPELALIEIFNNFNLIELVKIRRVCKLWKNFSDKHMKALVLFVDLPTEKSLFWNYNGQVVSLNSLLSIEEKMISNESFLNFFSNIKTAKLLVYVYELNLGLVNKILTLIDRLKDNLKHLEIDSFQNPKFEELDKLNIKLELKRLKTLTFFHLEDVFSPSAVINFLNLESLITYLPHNEKMYEGLKNLKYLHIFNLTPEIKNYTFKNLEILIINTVLVCLENNISLSNLPSLKELQLYTDAERMWSGVNRLSFYLKEKKMNKRYQLKIFFQGFEYTEDLMNQPFLFEICFTGLSEDYLEYYKKNHLTFHAQKSTVYGFELNDSFLSSLESLNSSNKKLINLLFHCSIKTDCNILRNTKLVLENCKRIRLDNLIDQHNLDQLPRILPNARIITLHNENVEDSKVDFSFISNFKGIKAFVFQECRIYQKALRRIIESCLYLKLGTFKDCCFRISDRNTFYILLDEGHQEFETRTKCLEYLNENKLFDEE